MKHTYLEWYEPKRGDRLAHHFLNLADKGGGNVDIVAAKLNTSADWAGGGLVSTVEDLNVLHPSTLLGQALSAQGYFGGDDKAAGDIAGWQ